MPLLKTSGNNTADAYAGGAAAIPNYIEDVFSTYLTTGAGSNITVVNGIDLAGKGGLVWNKTRSTAGYNTLFDTVRGANYYLASNTTGAQGFSSNILPTFNSDGFVIGTDNNLTTSGTTGVSWTFRKQPKFFDVVTYTGNGTSGRTITSSLFSSVTNACVMVKRTDSTGDWQVFHPGDNTGSQNYLMRLNSTAARETTTGGINANGYVLYDGSGNVKLYSGSTDINNVNASGGTYVAYFFASNAGGFGLTGTDNVISCGSFTTDGSGNAASPISLGYEPQWIMMKDTSSNAYSNWIMFDTMRGWVVSNSDSPDLLANNSSSETPFTNIGGPTATGFNITGGSLSANKTYIYIAIRRGPMKVPTDATKVFQPVQYTSNNTNNRLITTGIVTDFVLDRYKDADTGIGTTVGSRLTGNNFLGTSTTAAEFTGANGFSTPTAGYGTGFSAMNGFGVGINASALLNYDVIYHAIAYAFQRAPSFFDEVCYTSTGASATFNHNLGVTPELIITRFRSNTGNWIVGSSAFGSFTVNDYFMKLNTTDASGSGGGTVFPSAPTSTTFTVGSAFNSGYTCVAYLFATCAGVSKVGSYTGNGTTQAIACGFTGGARFVLIKRTDDVGGWYVYDTARGMTTLTDPYLLLNSTAAESATLGSVTTTTGGFTVNASILAAINTNGASYLFLAIA